MTVKVHFDGKYLVPDEPLHLPLDTPLVAEIHPITKRKRTPTLDQALGFLKTNGAPPTDAEVQQIIEEERQRKYG